MPAAKPTATWEGHRITPIDVPLLSTGLNGMHPLPEGNSSLLSGAIAAGMTRQRQASFEAGYAEHLSREGENLSLVIEYLHDNHPAVFSEIMDKLKARVPGAAQVESKQTEEGRILLRFQDGAFEDPFLARYVSDGTIKMLAYLVLLYDPAPHPLLCVEEPGNQLYPTLLLELAEEFRSYAHRGG